MDIAVEQRWWQRQDLSSLTETELRMVSMRYGLGQDGKIYTLKEIGTAVGLSSSYVWKLLERIRVRVDRATLLKAGEAMQLTNDDSILRGHLHPLDSGVPLSVSDMFDRLEAIGVVTFNQLMDKSPKWLLGSGVGRVVARRIESALNAQGMYLRGTVPPTNTAKTRLTLLAFVRTPL